MRIELTQLSKRYRYDWIFKNVDTVFQPGERCAILGPNGSGKSTLLKVLSGHLTPTKGKVRFVGEERDWPVEEVYRFVGYAAPYIELIEEFTLEEAIQFHSGLKPLLPGLNPKALQDILALPKAKQKEIRFFSSGMKQRLRLALAICSDTPVLLLDEPATNLDVQGIAWYKQLIARFASDRIVVIASNDPHDAEFCARHLNIMDYK